MKAALIIAAMAVSGAAQAATQQEAEAALKDAKASEAEAAKLTNRWVPTERALKTAQKALDAGKWDEAAAQATEAKALAEVSIQQAKEQMTAWHDAVIH
ncbi:MAG TPA: hypothetical protein VL492_05250 [Methylovirgula sp.]|jgi:hypothetical protein|nr:hypothetical protein [Methylovirgula sp.]